MEKEYYLYRQVRLDKNEPFYIGIGTVQKGKAYSRMGDKYTKNKIWNDIVTKTDYISEVMMHSKDDNFIQEKEREFIALYGRICKNNGGILANIEVGGRSGERDIGKRVYCINNKKYYDSIKDASRELELEPTAVSRVRNKICPFTENYIFRKVGEENDLTIECFTKSDEVWKPLIDEKYGYYISNLRRIKKVEIIRDDYGSIIYRKEKEVKPVVRNNGISIQMTISFGSVLFNINLRKEYFNNFNISWNDAI